MRDDTNFYINLIKARSLVESTYEWRKWIKEIPELSFSPEWKVKVIPPFGGAVARFIVSKGKASISVYLDCYGELGAMSQPYWEIYPNAVGDNERFYINETEELLQKIQEALDSNKHY